MVHGPLCCLFFDDNQSILISHTSSKMALLLFIETSFAHTYTHAHTRTEPKTCVKVKVKNVKMFSVKNIPFFSAVVHLRALKCIRILCVGVLKTMFTFFNLWNIILSNCYFNCNYYISKLINKLKCPFRQSPMNKLFYRLVISFIRVFLLYDLAHWFALVPESWAFKMLSTFNKNPAHLN